MTLSEQYVFLFLLTDDDGVRDDPLLYSCDDDLFSDFTRHNKDLLSPERSDISSLNICTFLSL